MALGVMMFLWLRNDGSWRVTALGVILFLWLRNDSSWRVTALTLFLLQPLVCRRRTTAGPSSCVWNVRKPPAPSGTTTASGQAVTAIGS